MAAKDANELMVSAGRMRVKRWASPQNKPGGKRGSAKSKCKSSSGENIRIQEIVAEFAIGVELLSQCHKLGQLFI